MNKVLDKHSKKADAVANLYRAALYLGRGNPKTGLDFLKKASEKVGSLLDRQIKTLLAEDQPALETPHQQRFWAEKILDQYHKLRLDR